MEHRPSGNNEKPTRAREERPKAPVAVEKSSQNGHEKKAHDHRRQNSTKFTSSEERTKYELERKKVAKYKEDKLKARRDHTRMILESHAQAKRRALLGKQSEFLVNLEFRNQLPDLPFDTKFLKYPHESDRLIKWKPNTLEQDYVFEIHEEPNLGLSIDLIDPAKYEIPNEPQSLPVGDEAVLMMKESHSKNSKFKSRPTVSWLRRTEYMGNDLYDSVHKFKSEVEFQSELREGTENALAEVIQISLKDRAEASFTDIKDPKILVHPFKKNLKPAKVWDVFPDPVLYANKYAVLSYDLLPSSDVESKNIQDREDRALLCGVTRKNQGTDHIQGSILLPNASQSENANEDGMMYGYFREYLLSVQQLENRGKEDSQHCVFMMDPQSNEFTYCDLMHRIQLKKTKLAGEEKRRNGAIVYRREYTETELNQREPVLFAVGGLYDESLDTPSAKRPRIEKADSLIVAEDLASTTIINDVDDSDSDNDSPNISDGSSELGSE